MWRTVERKTGMNITMCGISGRNRDQATSIDRQIIVTLHGTIVRAGMIEQRTARHTGDN
jgi:hypothetical protein